MIERNQPTIFDGKIIAAVSSVDDGNMKFGRGDDAQTVQNRIKFFEKIDAKIDQATLVQITYDTDNFTRYATVDTHDWGSGMRTPQSDIVADALVAKTSGHALFLPLADCAGVILYDPTTQTLMLSHIGRHSAEVNGAKQSVDFLVKMHRINPTNVQVWIGPSVGKQTYPLQALDNASLNEVIMRQLQQAGVLEDNIEISTIDTATDLNYFSHSQYKAQKRPTDGRFAIVAALL